MKRLQKRKHACPKVAVSGKSDIYICQSRANVKYNNGSRNLILNKVSMKVAC